MIDTLITNARIITMDDTRPVIDLGCIGISNGKIQFITDKVPGGTEAVGIIDAHANIIMPGLINTHSHAAMSILRGYADDFDLKTWLFEKIFPAESCLTKEAVLTGVKLSIAEMLASGTTSFSDMYFYEPDSAEIVLSSGIRASLSNGVTALDSNYSFENDRAVKETYELINSYNGRGNDRIRADASIHAEYTSNPRVWQKIAALAKEHNLIIQIHVSETKDEHERCIEKYGVTPLQALNNNGVLENRILAAHGVWLSDEDMNLLAKFGGSVAHNPISNLKLGSGIANISRLITHGVNVALGTDGCASNNNLDLFEEIKLASLLAKGINGNPELINAYEALKLATVNGAIAQGRENEVGKIKAGFEADLIMLNVNKPKLHPLYDPISTVVYACSGSDVCMTMVQGKILYKDGIWYTLDVPEIMNKADEIADTLFARRGLE